MSRPLALDAAGRLTNRVFLDDARVATVLDLLNRDGEAARVVGGAVRNALLDLPPGDIDVATTATPEVGMARAKAARLRTVPTGLAHGTVTVLARGLPLEVTTLREDVDTDGRHAVVRFGRDFGADAHRRDFTVNAMSADPDGTVHDTTGGVADLAAGRVRFIGDAATRIREDYLRILRFFRFSASYATGALDPEGIAAGAAGVAGLARLSRERVRAELLKLLVAPRAAAAVDAMAAAGVLGPTVGVPPWPERLGRVADIEAAGGWDSDAARRLAALAIHDRREAELLRTQLRLSNEERDRLLGVAEGLSLIARHRPAPDAAAILHLLHACGRAAALDTVMLRHAESPEAADDPAWQAAARAVATLAVPVLPVSGSDLLDRGLAAGPRVGAVLKDVQARWIRAGFAADPATIHRLLDEAIAAAAP